MKLDNLFIRARKVPTQEKDIYKIECKITPIIGHIYVLLSWLFNKKNSKNEGE